MEKDNFVKKITKKVFGCFAEFAPETATKILFKKYCSKLKDNVQ